MDNAVMARLARSSGWRRFTTPHGMTACLVWIALSACSSSGPPPPVAERSYAEDVQAKRATKDDYLRKASDSPLPEKERATFPGLPYFPVDPAFRVPASLQQDRTGPPVIITLETTAHGTERMERVGTLSFSIGGAGYTLSAFAGAEGLARLFVPFHDLTNRVETYGGGRYLNLDRTASGVYDLDFNAAYHPYCVYNKSYECPIPPAENRLDVAIRAGERLPEGFAK